MHKEYKHPAPYRPDHDYIGGIRAADKHIKEMTKKGTHPGQAQHLGGMASYHNHLEKLHNGEAHKVRQEIKHVLDYLFYYNQTDHDIYHFLAEEVMEHAEKMIGEIEDQGEKERAKHYADCAKEYLHWLKEEKMRHRSMGHHGGHSPYMHDNSGKMVTPREMNEHKHNPNEFNMRMEGVYGARRGGGTRSEMEYNPQNAQRQGNILPYYDDKPYGDENEMRRRMEQEARRGGNIRNELGFRAESYDADRRQTSNEYYDVNEAARRGTGTRSEYDMNEAEARRRGGNTRNEAYPQGINEEMRRGGGGGNRSEMENEAARQNQNPQGANPGTVNL